MKLEYLRKTIPYPQNSNEADKFLDERGQEGWELIETKESDSDPYSTMFLFKRPLEEVQEEPDVLLEEIPDEELPDEIVESRKSWMYKIYKIFKEKLERSKYDRH